MQRVVKKAYTKLKKIYAVGVTNSLRVVFYRYKKSAFIRKYSIRALAGTAAATWQQIAKEHELPGDFQIWFAALREQKLPHLCDSAEYDTATVYARADEYLQNRFTILGSAVQSFTTIPWHTDIRLQNTNSDADVQFDRNQFYADISITQGNSWAETKDIKVPWELSRFHHGVVLGLAYALSGDERYAHKCVTGITDWLDNNPFLLGVNWVCPMEVAIRAINLLECFSFLRSSPSIIPLFWERFVCALYDHYIYLEHNVEFYDSRTNNHYLSDLLGYFYLTSFFSSVPGFAHKRDACFSELVSEISKQVADDGASYEGSTSYHRLVTEIVDHSVRLAEQQQLAVPEQLYSTQKKMHAFVQACTTGDGTLLTIGDNDSGYILPYTKLVKQRDLDVHCVKQGAVITHYNNFGLSVMQTSRLHVTLRHHVYKQHQPSGHFHNDAGSITVAVDGKPIIIDPGSYLYTPSAHWRNYFRSVERHSTFYLEGCEPVPCTPDLFSLDLPDSQMALQNDTYSISSHHRLYARYGLIAERNVMLKDDHTLIVRDQWKRSGSTKWGQQNSVWSVMLAHDVIPQIVDNGVLLSVGGVPVLQLSSDDLIFAIGDVWVSSGYGKKVRSKQLEAARPFIITSPVILTCKVVG